MTTAKSSMAARLEARGKRLEVRLEVKDERAEPANAAVFLSPLASRL
jgi:hypothetical protein